MRKRLVKFWTKHFPELVSYLTHQHSHTPHLLVLHQDPPPPSNQQIVAMLPSKLLTEHSEADFSCYWRADSIVCSALVHLQQISIHRIIIIIIISIGECNKYHTTCSWYLVIVTIIIILMFVHPAVLSLRCVDGQYRGTSEGDRPLNNKFFTKPHIAFILYILKTNMSCPIFVKKVLM